jgi:dTDP-4-dehydrorhamnose 3,5-epimerase
MKFERLAIPELVLFTPARFGDSRGFFSETWKARDMQDAGIDVAFVQDNHSMSQARGVLRGLHCQLDPHAQGKLMRVVRGSIWDVAVDARRGSRTFGRHVAVELSAANWQQLWIPPGFLHGFCTMEPDTEVVYKTTDYYNKDSERAVRWNDPDLAIPWPITEAEVHLSDKDKAAPSWAEMPVWFRT